MPTFRKKKRLSPLAKDVLIPASRPVRGLFHCRDCLKCDQERTSSSEEAELLQALNDESVSKPYRSYLPARPLETQPANCIAVHPTETRFCKVAVYRYMHQVEKERKNNDKNKLAGVAQTTYVTWQYMPADMVKAKRCLGDRFFDTNRDADFPL